MTTAAGTTPNAAYAYSAFGYTLSTTGTLVQPYRYGQGYTDDATGLIKLGVRYYDPVHGRFTQQDPTGQDPYAYSYGGNSASTFNDPTGASIFGAVKCAAAITLALGGGVRAAYKLAKVVKGLGGVVSAARLLTGATTYAEKAETIGKIGLGLAAEVLGIDTIQSTCF